MEISQVHNITFDTEESIITATVSAPDELVMLMSSGNVIRYDIDEQKGEHLFSVKSSFSHEDGGFDINAKSTIYTLDSIVVIVNDYKRHGFVHYPNKYKKLHLWRKDYHADISCYPISLFKNEEGTPHLIYGEAWNHLQIMNLDSRQILTASKSLIEENAEERHLEFYKNHKEDNKLSWPRPYDYFFGKLEMSPNNKFFLSAGWAWGSCDAYNIYEVEHFTENNRIADINIGGWEHSNRAVCWIDNKTVAIAYNPLEEDDEDSTKDSQQEIHFYNVGDTKSEIERKVQINGLDIVNSKFHFNKDFNSIILLSDKEGVVLLSLDGKILFQDEKLNLDTYCSDLNMFVKVDDKSIIVHRIKNKKTANTV
ncbi:MAG: hypothetical protein ACJASR_001684 [Psychroserpens sp.]|jgi:hypothetical protein